MKKLITLFCSLCLAVVVHAAPGKIADISHADLTAAALLRHLYTALRRADTWLPRSGA